MTTMSSKLMYFEHVVSKFTVFFFFGKYSFAKGVVLVIFCKSFGPNPDSMVHDSTN